MLARKQMVHNMYARSIAVFVRWHCRSVQRFLADLCRVHGSRHQDRSQHVVGPTMPRKVINLDCTPGEAARERNLLMCHFTSCCYRAAQLARHRLFLQEVAMNLLIHLRLPRHIVYSVVYTAYPHFADMAKAKKRTRPRHRKDDRRWTPLADAEG